MSTVAGSRHGATDEFTSELHVYEPHRVGLPPVKPYLRELWRRRQFALELARSNLRAQNYNTALGQLWLVLNPLLLGIVYFMLVTIVRGDSRGSQFLAHLLLGVFTFRLVSGSIRTGAKSVTSGGRLILNTAFPRALLPLASVLESILRFLPTLLIYAVIHAVAGLPLTPEILWGIPILALMVCFAAGMTMLVATAQVYFRDVRNFLPFFLRIGIFASPILYYADEVPDRIRFILYVNPLAPMLTALSDAVNLGETPSAGLLAASLAWAAGALVVGGLLFVSREREFAIRL
ncbi:MAG TPA: ABC transporter permease [Gaiellaceae bacterium]|nr:ABC transporter permease [Gaiellaceae bacterium]